MSDETPSGDDGHQFTFKFLVFILILLALSPTLGSWGTDSNDRNGNQNTQSSTTTQNANANSDQGSFSFWDIFFRGDNLKLGDRIVSKGNTQVYTQPEGLILGLQDAGVDGRIIEGPIKLNNLIWWNVDFVKIPDGWIRSDSVTNNTGLFHFLNFFPWLFGFMREILIFLGIIVLILIIWVSVKRKKFYKEKEERKKLSMKKTEEVYKFKKEIKVEEKTEIKNEDELPVHGLPFGESPKTQNVSNRRWENIKTLMHSHNKNDWKQAVLEADIILEEMLEKMGYEGDSIGDKLKQVESSDFLTLDKAWEAHKFRNRIAHQGMEYKISKDEVERIIGLFEEVFQEFYFV